MENAVRYNTRFRRFEAFSRYSILPQIKKKRKKTSPLYPLAPIPHSIREPKKTIGPLQLSVFTITAKKEQPALLKDQDAPAIHGIAAENRLFSR